MLMIILLRTAKAPLTYIVTNKLIIYHLNTKAIVEGRREI